MGGRERSGRWRVDDQDLLEGLTCYARLPTLPGGRRAALQIATSTRVRAENLAAYVHPAVNTIEALADRCDAAHNGEIAGGRSMDIGHTAAAVTSRNGR